MQDQIKMSVIILIVANTSFFIIKVSDVFRKALESVPPEQIESGNEQLTNLYKGLSMTEGQMLNVSQKFGSKMI